ncbi:MAG TPA: DUF4010 domain-containing protein [Rudaea sp.]|nr:DUF4010 domain-containing protein [Rudaea sp.]
MDFDTANLPGLLAALGGGLLVGTERERKYVERGPELSVGIRTCVVAAMTGAAAALLGSAALVAAAIAVAGFALASYGRSQPSDPGLTTEFALLATYLLGALAMSHPQLAAALFVLLTATLASKEPLHRFSRQVLTQQELTDALVLAASALIVLPLLPDRPIDPFTAINPRKLWLLVVWVMAINMAGHVGLRTLGSRRGLPLAGLFGGFVSSIATIAGMGQRARQNRALAPACVAAGLMSNVATIALLALILVVVAPAFLLHMAWPLLAATLVALTVCAVAVFRARGLRETDSPPYLGRSFSIWQALLFALIVAVALFVAAVLHAWIGVGGIYAAAAAAGFADVHAATVAIGQLASTGAAPMDQATMAFAIAFSANSVMKCLAATAGGVGYLRPLAFGVVAINVALLVALAANPFG